MDFVKFFLTKRRLQQHLNKASYVGRLLALRYHNRNGPVQSESTIDAGTAHIVYVNYHNIEVILDM